MVNVTKTYLPPFEEYTSILKRAWEKGWLTNNGELVQELELKLKEYLNVKNLWFAGNGTIVLQMALKALKITKDVITTPFSYVATTNSIIWEGCNPTFVDIDPYTFCIDANKIEAAITSNTQAILATHVYGIPCDVEAIDAIAKKHNLKVIYDGAHAFGCTYNGKSLLSYGDISTCSFHATKLFHTVEGGCIIANDDTIANQLMLFRQFGHVYEHHYSIGVNGKNSELHAAMGLCVLPQIENIINDRKKSSAKYNSCLSKIVQTPLMDDKLVYNYGYYPIVLNSQGQLLKIIKSLAKSEINGRRYFYPSLNKLPYLQYQSCPFSEDISSRIFCLPLYFGLKEDIIEGILDIIINEITLSC